MLRDFPGVSGSRLRFQMFTDDRWSLMEPLLPSNAGRQGHPFGEHRRVVEGIAYRYRTGIPWRDLAREQGGPAGILRTFVEVPFGQDEKQVDPDGVVQVSWGKRT